MTNIFITVLLLIVDAIGAITALLLTYSFRFGMGQYFSPFLADLNTALVLTFYWWIVFLLSGSYRPAVSITRFDEILRLFKSIVFGLIVIFVVTIDIHDLFRTSRLYLLIYGVFTFMFVTAGRMAIREFQIYLRWKGKGMSNAVIVGYNDVGRKLQVQLTRQPVWGYKVVGFIDSTTETGETPEYPILGDLTDISAIVREHKIKWILLAPERDEQEFLFDIMNRSSDLQVRFMIVADYYRMVGGYVRTVMVHGLPLVEIITQPVPLPTRIAKRTADILIGMIVSLFYLLSFPIVTLFLRMESRGKIISVMKRVGKQGKPFILRNFFLNEADEDNKRFIISRFLRRTRLYRLPEFYSVLTGDMSLVGPRAESLEFYARYESQIPLFRWKYRIKPGITGWSQIRYRYRDDVNDIIEMTKYDLYYIDRVNIALDLWILLSSLKRVIIAN